ncbi:MAG TPA: cytochrome c-type biogenesis protein CcmH [Thermoflexales bacterium]|nr:cytochrome c-type biogenesis protein CcmH [Thermoflexales bacterium]HQZ52183.1 cytochrome c-type biogenesis protein CcmH [Thermoflexales bacterium]HRA55484.1 cytochrome c-type biogenesis protein CcmH [Thermoflexales bacterium]
MSGRPGRAARFILGALVLFLGVLLAARPTQAQDGSLEEQTREIAKNLNCPTCAGRNLADCPTDTCAQWKGEISTQLKAGRSAAQVTEYFIARFGPGVLQEPPREGGFLLAWIFPIVVFVGLIAAAFYVVRNSSRRGAPTAPAAATAADPYAVELERQVREEA